MYLLSRLLPVLSVFACSALGGTSVTFRVTDAHGTPQNCEVVSFREISEARGRDYASRFTKCSAEAIPVGTYGYSLGGSRQGLLIVNGPRVLKIIEDYDRIPGLAVEMPSPNEVFGRVVFGRSRRDCASLRLRVFGLWGGSYADSEIDINCGFYFPGVPTGSYTLVLVERGKPIWSGPLLKSHRPAKDLRLEIP